jgi:hypothetical protein
VHRVADDLEIRINNLLEIGPAEGSVPADGLLAEGYARALRLDAERLVLERRITALAARADDPDAAQELRRAWLRRGTIMRELRELRALLRRLKDEAEL